jgi:hypothetical protein
MITFWKFGGGLSYCLVKGPLFGYEQAYESFLNNQPFIFLGAYGSLVNKEIWLFYDFLA